MMKNILSMRGQWNNILFQCFSLERVCEWVGIKETVIMHMFIYNKAFLYRRIKMSPYDYVQSLCAHVRQYFSYNMAWSPYCMLMLTAAKCSSSAFLLSLQCVSRQHIETSCLHTRQYVNVSEICNVLECFFQDVRNKQYQQEISLLPLQ